MKCNAQIGALVQIVACVTAMLSTACSTGEWAPTAPGDDSFDVILPDIPAPPPSAPDVTAFDGTLQIALPGYGDQHAQSLAETDLLVVQLRAALSDDGAANIRRLREENPDLVVIGSLQLLTIFEHWNDAWHRPRMTLGAALWDILHDRPALSTTGAVVPMWDRMETFNPMLDGRLDDRRLDAVVTAIAEHFARYPDVCDGILHDYTSESPWIYPSPEQAGIGEVDLDGDGVGFADDPDEQPVWIAWQEEFFRRLQARIGPGLIQIGNGKMAIERPSTMQLLAGALFEEFPSMTWHQAPQYGFDRLEATLASGGLIPRRGRTWNLIGGSAFGSLGAVEMRRLGNLLYGGFYTYRDTVEELVPNDPSPYALGAVSGQVTRERIDGGGLRISREYEQGVVMIDFAPNGSVRASSVAPR